MRTWGRRLVVALLFAALVLVLLRFQGVIGREELHPVPVPIGARVEAGARMARVERRVLPSSRSYPGFVEAVDPAAIAARVMAGVLSVEVREGDPVQAGALVVALDDRDAQAKLSQAEAALAAAEAQALQARLAFDRAQRLLDAQALTTQEWEAARAGRDAAAAQEQQAREAIAESRTALTWFRLEAPFDGLVLERMVEPGDLATPGRPLLRIYRGDALRLSVAVPEERAAELEPGSAIEVAFDRLGTRPAQVTRVLPPADPRTGTVTLHLALEPTGDLRPGQLGRLDLGVGERETLVVPAEAVERIGQIERVRLVRDGCSRATTIRTGKQHDGAIEVLSGLAEGDEVVLP